jgi:flagellar protein FliS
MMTARAAPNPYLRTKVLTARPEELRLMLFDGAIRFAGMAKDGIAAKDYEKSYEGVTRCQAILLELINSLRPEHDPELCQKLSALYTFMYTRMIEAGRQRDAAIVDEVLGLLRYERETWVLVMEQLAKEHGGTDHEANSARTGGVEPAVRPAPPSAAPGASGYSAAPASAPAPGYSAPGFPSPGRLSLQG